MKVLIKYNKLNLMELCSPDASMAHKFLPGVNELDEKMWVEISKHPIAEALVEDGSLEVIGENTPFEKMKEPAQMKLVSETVDKELLAKWASSVKGAKVKKAIEKKLEELELSEEEKEQKE